MINNIQLTKIIQKISTTLQENKEFLTELDNVIGDGDHGINLARGFKEVDVKLPTLAGGDVGNIIKSVGMTLVSKVGGASGPLYGTAFMKAGAVAAGEQTLSAERFIQMLEAAIEGIQMRGKAVRGEKTMLDALIPAYITLKNVYGESDDIKYALERAIVSAKEGVEYTKTIIATKGRASYLGERSIGHQDPGATSALLILEAIHKSL